MDDQKQALQVAVEAARVAGDALRAELLRAGGPRGARGHAPIDAEVELLIRHRIRAAFPDDGFRAEEHPEENVEARGTSRCTWLVDPNDGTRAFLQGHRGASVSIARICDGVPILGVVFAYAAPDCDGDLIAWAEGCGPLQRNGQPIPAPAWPTAWATHHVVLVSDSADRRPLANARSVMPARYRPVPGIAYRLALAAAGDGVAAISLFAPRDFDFAAGHALIRGAGGALVDERNRPVRYHADRPGALGFCFGGAPALLADLVGRDWNTVLRTHDDPPPVAGPVTPVVATLCADAGVLARAQGCWLGQLAGDALGSQVEFESPARIANTWPTGVRKIKDGGTFNTIAGQPTDDSELAIALARTLVAEGRYDADATAAAYAGWLESRPFDIGTTTRQALQAARLAVQHGTAAAAPARAAANASSQANGALMRVSPLAIAGAYWPEAALCAAARADAALTHPHPVCQDANALFALTIAFAIRTGASAEATWAHACARAEALKLHPDVRATLAEAAEGPPPDCMQQQGWVRIALRNALFQLRTATTFEAALVDTVGRGGDTDTNGCIAGALLGAVVGRDGIPVTWRRRVLTCRPIAGLPVVKQPRPPACWPIDALVLPERLLAVQP